jgi:nicotinate-nucleotide adenylyltransferase
MTDFANKKIGLFGISANPPHNGHVAMASYARDFLGLDEIWFVVAAQNPLKSSHEMAPFEDRLEMTRIIAQPHDWLKTCDIEQRAQVNKSYDTLRVLKNEYPDARFVWIIGGDNLTNFHKWYKWQEILNMIPVAVMTREGDIEAAVKSPAAQYATKWQVSEPHKLADHQRGWLMLDNPLIPLSSTQLREAFKDRPGQINGTPPAVIERIREKGLYL